MSDSDRGAVVERLAAGLADGRLDAEEYEERLGLVLRARTVGELAPVAADLPLGPVARRAELAARQRQDLQEWLQEWRYWLGAAVLMLGIWSVQSVAAGSLRGFWPGVPLALWAVVLLAVAVWPSPHGHDAEPDES